MLSFNGAVQHVSLMCHKATQDKESQLAAGLEDVVCDRLADRRGDITADRDKATKLFIHGSRNGDLVAFTMTWQSTNKAVRHGVSLHV